MIGVDNDPMICDIGDPPLTSIALNVESAGYEAVKLLDQLINNQKIKDQPMIMWVAPIAL